MRRLTGGRIVTANGRDLLLAYRSELLATVPVIAETSWLILDRLGAQSQLRFLRMVTSGEIELVELTVGDWLRCVELVEGYSDLRLDLMDASVVAVAERLGIKTVATMNHRDFRVVQPRHTASFDLLP